MKALVQAVLYLTLGSISVLGQNGGGLVGRHTTEPSAYELGGRSVKIPAPENFTETMRRYPQITGRLNASESPLNEVLAAYVTDTTIPLFKDGGEPDIPFYTKVSVPKHLKTTDVSSEDFRALAEELQRQSPSALQSVLKKDELEADTRLSSFWGSSANLKVGETRVVGYFDDQKRSISSLFISNTEVFGRKFPIIGTMSMLHVNGRLIFLYVFRVAAGDGDKNLVVELTRAWVAKTVQVNLRSES